MNDVPTGSINSLNASLSDNSNWWLKHHIKEIKENLLVIARLALTLCRCLQKHHQKKEKQFCFEQIQENVYEILQK